MQDQTSAFHASFVGRDRELRELQRSLPSPRRKHAHRVLVVAPPGMGKTKLVEEFAAAVDSQGDIAVFRATALATSTHAYEPIAQLLRAEPEQLIGPADRDAIFTAWLDALDALSGRRPVLLVVDDVQLASPDVRTFLEKAGREPGRRGRLVLAAARPALLESDPAWCAPGDHTNVMVLSPLPDGATRALVRGWAGAEMPAAVVNEIAERSDGMPLFAEELVRTWMATGQVAPPSTLHSMYQSQLAALPPPGREVARLASVVGRTFTLGALTALGAADVDGGTEALVRAQLISQADDASTYQFRHALLHEAIYVTLTNDERAALHLRLARAFEAAADGVGRAAAADHYAAAVDAGAEDDRVRDQAVSSLTAAGDDALVAGAHDAAARLYERALEMAPGDDTGRRQQATVGLARAHVRAGRLPAAMETYRSLAALGRLGDHEALAEAALGYEDCMFHGRVERRRGDPSLDLIREALTALPDGDSPTRARLLAALGRALVFAGRRHEATEAVSRAVDMARRSGDKGALAYALLAQRLAEDEPDRLLARLSTTEQIARAAASAGNEVLELEAVRLKLVDLLELGDLEAADDTIARATRMIDELGLPLYRWYPAMWHAMRALVDGRYDDAERLVARFRREGRRSHYRDVDQVHLYQLFLLRREQGRVGELDEDVARMADRLPAAPGWAAMQVAMAVELGRGDEAAARLRRMARDRFAVLPDDRSWTTVAATLAEAIAAVGDVAAAEVLYEQFEPWAGHNLVTGSGACCLGSASHYLGLLADVLGLRSDAVAHFEAALALHDAMPAPPFAALSRFELARALAGVDPDRSAALLADAAGAARVLGMRRLEQRAAPNQVGDSPLERGRRRGP